MDILNEIKQIILDELNKFEEQLAESLRSDSELLNSAVNYFLSQKGKNLRPLLVFLAAKACSGIIKKQTMAGAISLELLHNASIIHDDIVDETLQRRGRPSLNAQFSNQVSVLVGDYFLSTALAKGTETNNMDIMRVISNIGKDLAAGEIEQLHLATTMEISEERYFKVINKKTASLFVACMQIAGLSVAASPENMESLTEFGRNLGLCFQIRDDIFDYFEDDMIGKPTGNDIREGKITLPLIHALLHSPFESEAYEANQMVKVGEYDINTIEFLIGFAKRSGGIAYAEEKMKYHRDLAIQALEPFANSSAKNALIKLVHFVVERNH